MMATKSKKNKTEWLPVGVADYDQNYEVTQQGQVRGIKNGNILKPGRRGQAGEFVVLTFNGVRAPFTTKKLVRLTFGDQPLTKAERDKQILKALATMAPKQVAEKFKVSVDTVRKVGKVSKTTRSEIKN